MKTVLIFFLIIKKNYILKKTIRKKNDYIKI